MVNKMMCFYGYYFIFNLYWMVNDLQELIGLNYLTVLEYLFFNFYTIFYVIRMLDICKYIKYTILKK